VKCKGDAPAYIFLSLMITVLMLAMMSSPRGIGMSQQTQEECVFRVLLLAYPNTRANIVFISI